MGDGIRELTNDTVGWITSTIQGMRETIVTIIAWVLPIVLAVISVIVLAMLKRTGALAIVKRAIKELLWKGKKREPHHPSRAPPPRGMQVVGRL